MISKTWNHDPKHYRFERRTDQNSPFWLYRSNEDRSLFWIANVIGLILLMLVLTSCAALYTPLVDLQGRDRSQYERDLAECRAYAEQVVGPGSQAVVGAVLGAVVGAALSRAAGREFDHSAAARVGALSGAAAGGASGVQDERSVVRNCLIYRGYRVLQ